MEKSAGCESAPADFLMNGADLVNSNVKNGAKYNYIKFKNGANCNDND